MTTDDTFLTSDNHALLLIDHQYLQLLAVRSHSNDTIVNNTVMLAKGAKIFGVPTLFATAFAERQELIKERPCIRTRSRSTDRTGLNSWDDGRVRDWVQATGRKKAGDGGPLDRGLPDHAGAVCDPGGTRGLYRRRRFGRGQRRGARARRAANDSRVPSPSPLMSARSNATGDGRRRPTTSPIYSPSWAADSDRGSVGSGSCWASRKAPAEPCRSKRIPTPSGGLIAARNVALLAFECSAAEEVVLHSAMSADEHCAGQRPKADGPLTIPADAVFLKLKVSETEQFAPFSDACGYLVSRTTKTGGFGPRFCSGTSVTA
jgi:hypothetical protein